MTNESDESRKHPQAHAWFMKREGKSDPVARPLPFITISRQAGAGGKRLAQAILREMEKRPGNPVFQDWHIFDQELCKMVVEDPQLKVSMESLLKEEYHSDIEDMVHELVMGDSAQFVVLKKIFTCVRTLAVHGKAVIVGRAGACLTRDLPLGVHVRLVASRTSRIAALKTLLKLSEKEACKAVTEQDRDRKKLIKSHFRKDIDDPLLYDAVWNTDAVPMEAIASSVVDLAELKARNAQTAG